MRRADPDAEQRALGRQLRTQQVELAFADALGATGHAFLGAFASSAGAFLVDVVGVLGGVG